MFASHIYKNSGGVVSDPNFKNVSLLLHGDGTNGAQNNTFLDSSTNNFTITRNGTPTQGSFSPYGNSWSNYFNGTTDFLTIPDSEQFNLAANNFTIECWVYFNSSVNQYYFGQIQANVSNRSFCHAVTGGKYYFEVRAGATAYAIQSVNNITLNEWTHIAAVRNGNTITLYRNGTSIGSVSVTGVTVNNSSLLVGVGGAGSYNTEPLNGYISNARLVNGTAIYTSNFTPSTSNLAAVAGTSLLTCQSNRFVDNSSNNFTITANGTPSVQPNSPFNPTSEYSISANGGSGFFPGASADYLTVNKGSEWLSRNADWTIECWFNKTANSGTWGGFQNACLASTNTGLNGFEWNISGSAGSGIALTFKNSSGIGANYTFSLNTWYHTAVVKQGSKLIIFVNGINLAENNSLSSWTDLNVLSIGRLSYSPYFYAFPGYISNFRITNAALYVSNFAIPTAPLTLNSNGGGGGIAPTASQVSLLCNFTNAGIFDNAAKNNLLTVGTARVSTAQKKYGSGSMLFNGSTDYCRTIAPAGTHQFGTGDFTIECWAYCTNLAGGNAGVMEIIDFRSAASNEARPTLEITSSSFIYFTSGVTRISSGTISENTWYHVAVVRSSGSTKLYVNGTNVGVTYADTNNYLDGSPTIGNYLLSPTYGFAGYIDDVRITKGIARYTANFTPPTQAFPNL